MSGVHGLGLKVARKVGKGDCWGVQVVQPPPLHHPAGSHYLQFHFLNLSIGKIF